jgi:hypothetical protein
LAPVRGDPFRSALVRAGDESLVLLLGDVLADLGIAILAAADLGVADVVLAPVRRWETARQALTAAQIDHRDTPIIVVLPFADEDAVQDATAAGAFGCYAMGTPLSHLRTLVRRALTVRPVAAHAATTEP